MDFTNVLGNVYAKVIGAVLSVALLIGGYYLVKDYFQDEAVATVQADAVTKVDKLEAKATESEVTLDKKLAKDRKVYEAKKQTVNDHYARDVASLQHRPGRSSGSSESETSVNSESQTGVTGARLAREDAEFLTRFASDTEELKLGLIQCYSDYDSGKETIDKFLDKF